MEIAIGSKVTHPERMGVFEVEWIRGDQAGIAQPDDFFAFGYPIEELQLFVEPEPKPVEAKPEFPYPLACHYTEADVYGGRGMPRLKLAQSDWHNPYVVGRDGTLIECLQLFKDYLLGRRDLMARLEELHGKRVGCFCCKKGETRGPDDEIICHVQVLARAARGDYDLELTPWPHTPKPFHPGDRIRCAYNDVAEHPAFPQFIHFGKIGTVISAPPGESDRPGRVWVQFDQESSKSPHHSKLLGHLRPLLTYDYVPEQPKPERQLDPEPEQPKAEQQPEPEPEVKPKRQRKPKPPAVPRLSHDDFVLLKQRFLYWLRRNAHHHTVVRWLRDDNEAAATNRFDLPPMRQVKFNEAMSEYQSQLSELEIQCVESAWNEAWLKAMNEEGDFLHELTEAPISAGDYVQVVAVSSHNQKFIGRVGSVIEISGNRYKVKVPGSPALTFSAKHLQRFTFKAQYLDAISDLIQTLSPQDIEEEAQWREAAGDLEAAQAYRTVRTPEEYNQLTLLTLA